MNRIFIKAESRYPVERKKLRSLANKVLSEHGISNDAELGISFVGDRKMKLLNKKYRKLTKTTDVLSFPLFNGKVGQKRAFVDPPGQNLQLGDIVISYPQARQQAMERNLTVDEEINILVEHGVLHLLGIHHE